MSSPYTQTLKHPHFSSPYFNINTPSIPPFIPPKSPISRVRVSHMRPKRPDSIDSDPPSGHLWVGNLPPDVNESELSKIFSTYGVVDGITYYSNRTYAFIYFKRPEDASNAKKSLQGFLINGSSIKIEFAKPAKPSKNVWVGGFGASVTKEKLEEELSKFGKIEEFKFFRERNNAVVEFSRVEDASAAVNNMNGLQIGVHRIRVDFLRSHGRREQSDFQDTGSAQFRGITSFDPSWNIPDLMRNYPEPAYLVHKKPQQPSQSFGGNKVGQPSKVLWVGYPPSVIVDEEMLHNAMILYGEIESIKCFPARHYSFVEFRSVEEARRAKEALQGRLFNDPRITIMFSNSDLTPGKDFGPLYPGYRGQGADVFGTEFSFRPPMMDVFHPNRGMAPSSFPGPLAPNGLLGSGAPRPFGPRGSLESLLLSPDFNDSMSDFPKHALGLNPRKLSPPASGLLPTPAVPARASHKTSEWDVLDPNQLSREPKRSKMDGLSSFNDRSLITGKGDEYIARTDRPYGAEPQFVGGLFPRVRDGRLSPAEMGVGKGSQRADEDYIWRGVIAKGGSAVCHARCIPFGKGLECSLPEVVNCSARTGLDMLTKHYASAIGFDIVFFLPDSEDDFANYTEFLRYLGSKNRAGVAKLDDGTTLFLVPPSEFLTDVLEVPGPERLYGVVLKLPQQLHQPVPRQQLHQPLPPAQLMENQVAPPMHDYVAPVPKMDLPAPVDYGRTPAETTLPPKEPFSMGSVSQNQYNESIPSTSRPGLPLTPELIAALTTLLPGNSLASVGQSAQSQLSSSTTVPSLPIQTNDIGVASNDWNQQVQTLDPNGHPSSQFSSQLYSQPSTTLHAFPLNLNPNSHPVPSSHPVSVHPENMQAQNPAYNLHEQSRGSTQGMQQPYDIDGMMPETNNFHPGPYGVTNVQQPSQPAPYPNQFHGANLFHGEHLLPMESGNMNGEPLDQAERLQPETSDVGHSSTEVEVYKNQRYQSTLQFAASLLLQIKQKQQQTGSHAGNQ